MYSDDLNASPINPLPAVVVVFALAIAGVELTLQAAERGFLGGADGAGWRLEAIRAFAWFDAVLDWMTETGRTPPEQLMRLVTYPFVHGGFAHAAFTIVFVLAIGKMVAEVFSSLAFVVIFVGSGVVGALIYAAFLTTPVALVGAYPPVYGLIGAMTFMLWVRARVEGTNQARAFGLIAALLAIQLVFNLIFGGGNEWVADIAGFLTGFTLSFVLAPDGTRRVLATLARLRRR